MLFLVFYGKSRKKIYDKLLLLFVDANIIYSDYTFDHIKNKETKQVNLFRLWPLLIVKPVLQGLMFLTSRIAQDHI